MDNTIRNLSAGQYGAGFAGGNTTSAPYTGAGVLATISVVTAGTAALSIYDGTQVTGATLIYTSATNPAAGTLVTPNLPFSTGLVISGTTGAAGLYVSYLKDGVNGK